MSKQLQVSDVTLAGLISRVAEIDGSSTAITAPSRSPLTYLDLVQQTLQIKEQLQTHGIRPAHKVAVVMPNGPEMATAVLGVAICATCAPLNPAYSRNEFKFYLGDLNAEALLVPEAYDGPANDVAEELGIRRMEAVWDNAGSAGRFELCGNGPEVIARPRAVQADDIALVLHTSGTTSRPKMVPLSHGNLCRSAHNVAVSLQLSAMDRCLNVMPLFHIHGIVAGLLASLTSGGSAVCTGGYQADQFVEWLKSLTPTWYTAVPTIHQAICADLANSGNSPLSSKLRFVRSSSSALSPAVARDLEHTLGVPVIEAYGMTEAAHQIASNPLPPGKSRLQSVGLPAGPEVAIMQDDGELAPQGETAEIVIRGDNVISGYENNAEANEKAFESGWFRTGDLGYIDADGYLFITGRLKEIINRGGEKVSPAEVDAALLEHPAVQEAITFSVTHETLGEDVAAVVVLKSGTTATDKAIRQFLFDRLSAFKIPSQIAIVDQIPKGATGKIQRIGLEEKLGDKLAHEFVAPRDDLEMAVAGIFARVLGIDEAGALDNFFAIGGDSITGFRLLARLNTELGVDLPIPELFRSPTVAELAVSIARLQESSEIAAIEQALDSVEQLSDEQALALLAGSPKDENKD